jgi:hypothetical protein
MAHQLYVKQSTHRIGCLFFYIGKIGITQDTEPEVINNNPVIVHHSRVADSTQRPILATNLGQP